MKNRSGEKIKLASIDELLGVVNEESAMEIEISKIHPFKNHRFCCSTQTRGLGLFCRETSSLY